MRVCPFCHSKQDVKGFNPKRCVNCGVLLEEEKNMINHCPLCTLRVSDWMMACGKTIEYKGDIYHKTCLHDFRIKHGHNHPAMESVNQVAERRAV